MADRRLVDQKFILECIRLYKDLPSLWNIKSKVYYDRNQKETAYKILLRKYRQLYPKATKEDLKKKFNALRTNYRKELRRYLQSVASGSNRPYQPTLWYYSEMNFLHDMHSMSAEEAEASMDADQNYAILLDVAEENSDDSRPSSPRPRKSKIQDSPQREPSPPMQEEPVAATNKRVCRNESLTNVSYENLSYNKDEYFHWAMACASDLAKMDPTQQVFAKKAIAEVLMEGQLGLLHRNAVKVNEQGPEYGHSSRSSGQIGSSTSYIQFEQDNDHDSKDNKPIALNPLEFNA